MRLRTLLGLMAFLFMSILHPCSKFGQGLPFQLSMVSARELREGPGSGGGGGGDYKQDPKPTASEVALAIPEARRLVPFVLNHLESVITNARATGSSKLFQPESLGDSAIPLKTYQQLFPWPEKKDDVQARWQRLRFNTETVKPCFDVDGIEKAASAVPLDSDDLCVSIEMIRNSAVKANLVQRVTALLVHEVSHKMGVEDHEILEKAVRDTLPANPRQALQFPLASLTQAVRPGQGTLSSLLDESLQNLTAQPDWSLLCYNLAAITAAAKDFAKPNVLKNVSMALLRPALEAEKQAIHLRTQLLQSYCVKDSQRSFVEKLFQGQSTKPIHYAGSGVLSIARGTLRRPEFKSMQLLKAELLDIKSSLGKVAEGVTKILLPAIGPNE